MTTPDDFQTYRFEVRLTADEAEALEQALIDLVYGSGENQVQPDTLKGRHRVKGETYTVAFRDYDIPALLEMLRYDAAVIVDNGSIADAKGQRRTVTFQTERYTRDRWSSFGLYPRPGRLADYAASMV